jgi:hypothetical protein
LKDRYYGWGCYYFSTQGCRRFGSCFVVGAFDELAVAAACCRAFMLKKSAIAACCGCVVLRLRCYRYWRAKCNASTRVREFTRRARHRPCPLSPTTFTPPPPAYTSHTTHSMFRNCNRVSYSRSREIESCKEPWCYPFQKPQRFPTSSDFNNFRSFNGRLGLCVRKTHTQEWCYFLVTAPSYI